LVDSRVEDVPEDGTDGSGEVGDEEDPEQSSASGWWRRLREKFSRWFGW